MVEGLKELAQVLQTVSGDAREVLLWWVAYKVGTMMLGYALGFFIVTLVFKTIKRALHLHAYSHRWLKVMDPKHSGEIDGWTPVVVERTLAEHAEVLRKDYIRFLGEKRGW